MILGNEVEGDEHLTTPIRFRWKPVADSSIGRNSDPKTDWGLLTVNFADGSVGVTRPLRASHVSAAISIVYTGSDGSVSPIKVGFGPGGKAIKGDGIGLAGYAGKKDFFVFRGDRVETVWGGARTFVVHPAIA